jgi:hypothetical protein
MGGRKPSISYIFLCFTDLPELNKLKKNTMEFFLKKMGNIASFYLKKKKRIDEFISGEPAENCTYAQMLSWNTTTLGTPTGRPSHMPTVSHTRQWKTSPTLTTSFEREIC